MIMNQEQLGGKKEKALIVPEREQILDFLSRFPDSMTVSELRMVLKNPKITETAVAEKMDWFAVQKFIMDNFVALDKRTNRNFAEIKKFFEEKLPDITVTESSGGTVAKFEDRKSKKVFLIPYVNTRIERAYIAYFPGLTTNLPVIRIIKMVILDISGEKEKIVQAGEVDQIWK